MLKKTDHHKVSLSEKTVALLENIVFFAIAIGGLIASMTAKWGGGSRTMHAGIFPRLLFVLVLIGAICMFFSNVKYDPPPKDRNIPVPFTVIFLLWVGLYFWCAMKVGFIVSTAVFLAVTISVFSSERKKHWKGIAAATAIATLLIWGVFIKIIGIVLPSALLF